MDQTVQKCDCEKKLKEEIKTLKAKVSKLEKENASLREFMGVKL